MRGAGRGKTGRVAGAPLKLPPTTEPAGDAPSPGRAPLAHTLTDLRLPWEKWRARDGECCSLCHVQAFSNYLPARPARPEYAGFETGNRLGLTHCLLANGADGGARMGKRAFWLSLPPFSHGGPAFTALLWLTSTLQRTLYSLH